MLRFTDATGLAGSAAAIVAASAALPGVGRLTRRGRAILLCGVAVVALAPLGPLPPAGYLRGLTGDLSIATLLLILRALCGCVCGWGPIEARNRRAFQALLAVGGLVLYPLALGIGTFDPYRLGFASAWLVTALLVTALAAWLLQLHLVTWWISLAVLAYAVGWQESSNLWDYLLDPLVAAYGFSGLLAGAARGLRPAPPSHEASASEVSPIAI